MGVDIIHMGGNGSCHMAGVGVAIWREWELPYGGSGGGHMAGRGVDINQDSPLAGGHRGAVGPPKFPVLRTRK